MFFLVLGVCAVWDVFVFLFSSDVIYFRVDCLSFQFGFLSCSWQVNSVAVKIIKVVTSGYRWNNRDEKTKVERTLCLL